MKNQPAGGSTRLMNGREAPPLFYESAMKL
jgi:hypothetical protein